ncbi:MAG: nucleotide sugar dehydrogenase [Acidimicrobiales bacterium]
MKVAVFGLGYVGTVTAACLASRGHEVTGVDVDLSKVEMIASGRSPVIEPGLDQLVSEAVAKGSLKTTTNAVEAVSGAEVSLICVGTPSAPNGSADLTYIARAVQSIGECIAAEPQGRPFHSVVIRSTVPPGTVDDVVTPVLESVLGRVGTSFGTAMCPEFLREGSGVADFFSPPFTVVGTEHDGVAKTMTGLLGFLDVPVRVVPTKTAEALKYACNAFHAAKVAFTNELSRVFRPLGIDSRTVMDLFCSDTQLNISPSYLRPGFAFGGPCLGKDLRELLHLARVNGVDLPLLSGTITSNEMTVSGVVNRITSATPTGATVALLGLSFKVSSDDLRESPNVELAETLVGKGYDVRIYDPVVKPSQLIGTNREFVEKRLPHLQGFMSETATSALTDAKLAVVSSSDVTVVEALEKVPPPRIIDLVGKLGRDVEALDGYEGVGW